MRPPRSTYRLQVNADFKLSQIRELIDYFAELGVSDLYVSPLMQAKPGSTHGYDVTHPALVNDEIGSAKELEELSAELRTRDMGILLDIVPNHMSASEVNPWWRDVLEHGPASAYSHFFDVDWSADPPGKGRLVLPMLADDPEACMECADLRVVIEDYEPQVAYYERRLPVDPATYPSLIPALLAMDPQLSADVRDQLSAVSADAGRLPARAECAREQDRAGQAAGVKQRLANALRLAWPDGSRDPLPMSKTDLQDFLEQQTYALRHWVSGGRELNYRRFFDIADLAGVRTDDREVFAAIHARSLPWLLNDTISGVRIDHIDGLREPTRYLQQLRDSVRQRTGRSPYVVVEKILVGNEPLPRRWATAGTTGYEFSGLLNGLFVDENGYEKLAAHFQNLSGTCDFALLVYECKKEVMRRLFPAELATLARALASCSSLDESSAENVIREVTAALPVYRTYLGSADSGADDAGHVDSALRAAAERKHPPELLNTLRQVLLSPASGEQRDFVLRWQQFSGPVMAKGLEDTALYRYTPLLSVCDVGSDPRQAHTSVTKFHDSMKLRAASWAGSLNATSTHDSKRGEDVRARINVLSELTDLWLPTANRWLELNGRFRRTVNDVTAPQPSEELALYQTLLGAWPLADQDAFAERVCTWLRKSLREARQRSSWREPNEAYENAVLEFARAVLADSTMREELHALERSVCFYGALNSLAQLVIKIGAPGLPDFYQGNEIWSLTLVDPDNRRTVDYAALKTIAAEELSWKAAQSWRDGAIKMHVTRTGLALRNQMPAVFAAGEYNPVEVTGERAHHLIAFERQHGDQSAVFVAGRYFTQLCDPEIWPRGKVWAETSIKLRDGRWREHLTNRAIEVSGETSLSELLQDLPFAMLTSS